ncbi:HpcH/HpaI aldolase/citrate lyase family protein [Nocardia yamanashiensis]|uniref:HpcH/HpaI aldolase/citrate lyase family protein n=1 Tax=Nocardia yamanashiensis TaxID=209247 RepID=UPI0008311BFA|nr:CoA ester lyase [Nocardia yamanashiensis]
MRSALYVPGNRPDLFDKALAGPADVVLLDLEDAVPVRDKDSARAEVVSWLRTAAAAGRRIWVRVNPGELGEAELRALAPTAIEAVSLAKTESAEQVRAVGALLARYETRPGTIRLCPLLESPAAVYAAREIAAAPRVSRLQLGEADLRADLGITPGPDERELLAVRGQVVLASAAAGIDPPIGPARTDFRDLDALRETTVALRRLGFRGRSCIHPDQVPVVNAVFTPAAHEVEQARELVRRYEAAAGGVLLDEAGRMVDLAVVRQARRLLESLRG